MAIRSKGHGVGGLGTAEVRLNMGTRERKAELLAVCEVLGYGLSDYVKRTHEAFLATLTPEVRARIIALAESALEPPGRPRQRKAAATA